MAKRMDLQGIEPWTTPMLREYYTTKPQARFLLLPVEELIRRNGRIHGSEDLLDDEKI
jgi:hypothetical protein